jgi:hypothetical protein
VIAAHQFIRTFQLEGVGKAEALAKAVLGIARLRATRETSHVLPPKPETLLTYSWGEEMPAGDLVLAALADTLHHLEVSTSKQLQILISTKVVGFMPTQQHLL